MPEHLPAPTSPPPGPPASLRDPLAAKTQWGPVVRAKTGRMTQPSPDRIQFGLRNRGPGLILAVVMAVITVAVILISRMSPSEVGELFGGTKPVATAPAPALATAPAKPVSAPETEVAAATVDDGLPPEEPASPEMATALIDEIKFFNYTSRVPGQPPIGPHVEVVGHEFGSSAANRRLAVIGPDFKLHPKVRYWSPGMVSFDSTIEPKLGSGGTYLVRIEQVQPPAHGPSAKFVYTPAPKPIDPRTWAPAPASGTPAITLAVADPPNTRANETVILRGSGFGTRGSQLVVMESAGGREELEVLDWADERITLRMSRDPFRGWFDPHLRYYYRIERPAAAGVDLSNALAFDFAPDCRWLFEKLRDRCERALAGRDECATRRTLGEMQQCLQTTPDPVLRAACAKMPIDRQRIVCEAQFKAEETCRNQPNPEAFIDCFEKNMPPGWRKDMGWGAPPAPG